MALKFTNYVQLMVLYGNMKYEIYCGLSRRVHDLDLSGSIVARLAENLLDEGRLIITDN